tara:strand:+ start:987 stop:1466 length:480 start_codon:yes stop_codon:yes gene_type:complete
MILVLFVAGTFNVFETLWYADQTKISFVILSLFTLVSFLCGWYSWKLNQLKINKLEIDEDIAKSYETGWFSSEICLTLGLIGTVSGFILMLVGAFVDLNVADPNSVSESLKKMSLGMSTALYTTLVGLLCSVILKVQFFRLEKQYEKLIKEKKNETRSL